MFGCYPRASWATSLAIGLLVTACDEKKAHELSFHVDFVCSGDQEASDQLQLRLIKGGCEGSETAYAAMLAKGEQAPAGHGIAPGDYGLAATALRQEKVVASSCVEITLPSTDVPELHLKSDQCEAPDPEDGGEGTDAEAGDASEAREAGASDGSQMEAGMDSSVDAGIDAGISAETGASAEAGSSIDAAPVACATDCKDPFPCTEDRCVHGECVHEPYTGTRECDGVACTEGDKCQNGSCVPGVPNHAACPDDGNPCTAETCELATGCNRDVASGGTCNDQIDCTGPVDTCVNGVCRGADTCTNGAVCSAASGMCISCGINADCDDRNPCTIDTCASGACRHVRNVGATCNDNKSCTTNDRCTETSCVGTSTCPSNATCAGSTCRCNDSSMTLCDDACVNTSSTREHCGQCERDCGTDATCENSACKPAAAQNCTAHRFGGHEYLVCRDKLTWTAARDRCRDWGLGLVIIDNADENDFLKSKNEAIDHWIGANDRGNNGNGKGFSNSDEQRACTLNAEEGKWYWASPSGSGDAGDNFRALCSMASDTATTCTLDSASSYQNWKTNEPNNDSCSCGAFSGCGEGEDCGMLYADGTWNDGQCRNSYAFICESP